MINMFNQLKLYALLLTHTALVTHSSHDSESLGRQEPRIANLFIDYTVKYLLLIFSRKWRLKSTNNIHRIETLHLDILDIILVFRLPECHWTNRRPQ